MIANSKEYEWQVPEYETAFFRGRTKKWCVVIPVINEGERIGSLLAAMSTYNVSQDADIIIADGGSTDGSLSTQILSQNNVCGLLIKTGEGKLSSQLRCAYSLALHEGYDGIITIDGNGKDDPKYIASFIECLASGADFVQASRFIGDGQGVNTPLLREIAIRYLHVPLLRYFSGFPWTDTTQGYRAYSRKMLLDPQIAPLRNVFQCYELLAYLSCRAPQLGYSCVEIATTRTYPAGEIPTKIKGMKGNLDLFRSLISACMGLYNPI